MGTQQRHTGERGIRDMKIKNRIEMSLFTDMVYTKKTTDELLETQGESSKVAGKNST